MAEINVNEMIDGYVKKAQTALEEFMKLDQEQIDAIVKAMTLAGLDKHMELAKMAVEETGRGVYEDKITKNMFATEYVYHSIKNEKTVGVIAEKEALTTDNWTDPERDIRLLKCKERYGVGILDNGKGICVARNIAVAPSYPEAPKVQIITKDA